MKMIKKVLCGILFFLVSTSCYRLQAQVLTVKSGTDVIIKSGTSFFADGITLTPSSDFTLSNISLNKNTIVNHFTLNNYIARVYQFSQNTNSFSGTVQINYQDGAELNGLSENDLQLNVHDGLTWKSFTSNTNDVVNNYVLSTLVSAIQLNELTLASALHALPLQWRLFNATKQNENVLLEWSTFTEHNTKNFIVQTGNGTVWNTLAIVPAAVNSNTISNYNYLHTTPASGNNYYRILETDLDGKYNYSVVRKVFFGGSELRVIVLSNPITNGILQLQVTLAKQNDAPAIITLYTADGKLLWAKYLGAGLS